MARILTCYYKPKPGGLCTRLFRSIRALLERGHEVHYLAVERYPIDHPACHFHRFPWPPTYAHGLFFWATFHILAPLLLLYIGLRRRITHTYAFGTTYAFVLQPLRAIEGVPLTLFLRADVIANHLLVNRPQWLLRLETAIEGFAIRQTCLYGVSKTLTEVVIRRHRRFQPKVARTLPNNIDDVISDIAIVRKHVPPRFACVGVIEPRKNLPLAVRAFAAGTHDATLTIYGDGPDTESMRTVIRQLKIEDRVSFAGWVPQDRLWQNIDVLLFPSLHEGAANAICEAVARKIPVIASDIPENRELLPPATLVPVNLEQWVSAIAACTDEPRRAQLQRQQYEHIAPLRFDWDAAVVHAILQCA